MTLRIKTLLAGGLTLITLIGLLYVVAARLLREGFAAVEEQEATKSVQRAVHALDAASVRLSEVLWAWSQCNESYEFIKTKDPGIHRRYVAKNLSDEILVPHKADIFMYVRNNGHLVFGTGYNQQTGKKVPLPSDILPHLSASSMLLRHQSTLSYNHGILLLRQGPLLLVSRPIITDVGKGAIHGSLVWGRYLDTSQIKELSRLIELPLVLQRLDSSPPPPDFQAIRASLTEPGAISIQPLAADKVAGYTTVTDIYGKPALLLRVDINRDIYQQGQISLRYLLTALLTISLIFGGLTLWVLERWVLAPVSVLSKNVEQIGASGDVSVRVPVTGSDELSQLSGSVNRLLAANEKAHHDLRVEIGVRQQAEASLRQSHDELERRVVERTGELAAANDDLQRAKEEADAANAAKSEFLSRMSHELRTPLNAILGFGQILVRQKLTPGQKESTEHILKGGRHLLGLVEEVLDITRVETGHMNLSTEPVAVREVIRESFDLMRPLLTEVDVQCDAKCALSYPGYVLADRQRLKQVLINLLSNAIKYNHCGGQVTLTCVQTAAERLQIQVQDTGLGIAAEDMTKLFMPFKRLHEAQSQAEGTGLGLVTAKHLTEAMQGTLTVASVPGKGSTFTIELPLATSPPEQLMMPQANESSTAAVIGSASSYTVLCIEDNLSNLRLIEAILVDRADITLLAAMQGGVGLDLARQHEPDLILLDLNLPDMHGKEVLTRLRQSAITKDIPVVVISADATPKQIELLLGAGARAYLAKPLNVDQVLHTLDGFLQVTPVM